MGHRSLADFLEELVSRGELSRVSVEVDPDLEVAEITRCVADSASQVAGAAAPALLFDRLRGSSIALVTNLLGSEARLCRAVGVTSWQELTERVSGFLQRSVAQNWFDRLRLAGEASALESYQPKSVKTGVCQQVVRLGRDVDLGSLPALQAWPGEQGRFITAGQLITQSTTGHERSVLPCRAQVMDAQRLAVVDHAQSVFARQRREYASRGEKMPVAIALGGDPAYRVAAVTPLPVDIDGFVFAGMLRGQLLEVVKCRTSALEVPADADLVLEGHFDPAAETQVGPHGAGGAHYRLPSMAAVMQLDAITHRAHPIVPAEIAGFGAGDLAALAKAKERILLPLVRAAIPELVELALPVWSEANSFAFVSIRKTFPFQARKVASALWGLEPLMHVKFVVVLDEEVDVHDRERVLSEIAANVLPGRDTIAYAGPGAPWEHANPTPGAGHGLAFDATKKLPAEHDAPWPDRLQVPQELADLVARRWSEYGLPDELAAKSP